MLITFSINRWFLLLIFFLTFFIFAGFVFQVQDTYQIPSDVHIPFSDSSTGYTEETGNYAATSSSKNKPITAAEAIAEAQGKLHPIDDLIKQAELNVNEFMKKETKGVNDAAKAYRKRRGRHPPPGFDQWLDFAESKDSVVIEDMFDQIYRDLEPFWALPPKEMRQAVLAWPNFISVRSGNTTVQKDRNRPWMDLWSDMVSKIAEYLPDVDIAINEMDEPRLLVPFEDITQYMMVANKRRKKPHPTRKSPIIDEYPTLPDPKFEPGRYEHQLEPAPRSYWGVARQACPVDSPGREARHVTDFSNPPIFPQGFPKNSYNGYVKNWTQAKDPCIHTHLREMHGSFVEPVSISTTRKLFPILGGSKLPMNNDILLPAAMYWTEEERYKGGEERTPWTQKKNGLMWRGLASGGRNRDSNWKRFQRHRFVRMMNGTRVREIELAPSRRQELIYPWPDQSLYHVMAVDDAQLGDWVNSFADAAFTDLVCFPAANPPAKTCDYTSPYFDVRADVPMSEQYKYKYLADMDGNSFSGRYRGFLRSYSLPIKATIYSEWHDDRLFPWKHFVPMDNTFVDIWGILEYFLGYDSAKVETHRTQWVAEQEYKQKQEQLKKAEAEEQAQKNAEALRNGQPRPEQGAAGRLAKRRTNEQRQNKVPAHDRVARYLAEAGHDWAERVLRKDDMLVYTYRLLLEYARVVADDRDRMGWVGDLSYDEEADALWGIGVGPKSSAPAQVPA